jgi:hypothetical protein
MPLTPDQLPPEVELKPPPPPDCGGLAGVWKPPWLLDELLLDPLELLDEPELELELDELELGDEPLPVPVTAAWLAPGRMTATTPATATLAKDTVTVVAFSRRRPSSRSATACATWRALLTCAAGRRAADFSSAGLGCSAACSSLLFTSTSVTRPVECAVGELSANVLKSEGPTLPPVWGFAGPRGTASI